jgi:two-component system NarL family response regulator
MMKVLLVDDHSLFLEGLQNLLTARGVHVVGTAHDGLEALEKARLLAPDIILMDVRMPRCDGLVATRLIKAERPECKIVMLTTSGEEEDLFEAIKSGASGYLLKSLEAEPFLTYLNGVMRGEAAISRELAATLLREYTRQAAQLAATVNDPGCGQGGARLTPRQLQILELVAQGLPYKQVASHLNLSEHTIKYHMGEILQCLHLKNREQVVAYALRTGLVKGAKGGPG